MNSIGFYRSFSVSATILAERLSPKWAAKQIVPENASRSKLASLKRKEKRWKRQIIRDINNFKQHKLKNIQFKVDPVLGDANNGFIKRVNQEIQDLSNLSFGYKRDEVEKLLFGVEKSNLNMNLNSSGSVYDNLIKAEENKRKSVLTILNLKNSNNKERKKIAVERAVQEFARNEGDTGSPEVQAAVLTVKIHLGMQHVKQMFKDKVHIQHVRELVQQRQRILKYLKKTRPEDYFYCIEKLGLTDDVIIREFNMDKQYFQDYKIWGDKKLIKLSEKQKKREEKYTALEKKITEYNELAKKKYDLLS
ncbi:37S ribosomal protein S28, mitochondrial [[Candida] jaroonii]|uniref:37S ribosomal protein S28, mitochondrial n=1 Tax=[Candida] jaroonii TaxID=467808 RepID=A0ACA9Y7J9_9ASCO|nr:37S ribosomal protein S28, mitochondrial [[Candida] jaroonii]